MKARFTLFIILFLFVSFSGFQNNVQAQGIGQLGFVAASKAPAAAVANKTMLETISLANRPKLTELLTNSGLLSYVSGSSNYTFFAPSEEALATLQKQNPDKIKEVLQSHLVAGRYTTNDLKEGTKLQNAAGDYITVLRNRGKIFVNGVHIMEANEMAANGVIHTVNGVFQPKN